MYYYQEAIYICILESFGLIFFYELFYLWSDTLRLSDLLVTTTQQSIIGLLDSQAQAATDPQSWRLVVVSSLPRPVAFKYISSSALASPQTSPDIGNRWRCVVFSVSEILIFANSQIPDLGKIRDFASNVPVPYLSLHPAPPSPFLGRINSLYTSYVLRSLTRQVANGEGLCPNSASEK